MAKETRLPSLEIRTTNRVATLFPQGPWLAKTASQMKQISAGILKKSLSKPLTFDLKDFQHFDTTGIWMLDQLLEALAHKGHQITLQNESQSFKTLSIYLKTFPAYPQKKVSASLFWLDRLNHIGKVTFDLMSLARDLIIFLGQVTLAFLETCIRPQRLRLISLASQIERCGVNAIPIIFMMSTALGLVLAYQGEEQLRRFGAEVYTINLVSISVLREVGILITAILVAGRTGSAMTAQIGIMKMNQEIDALNTMGLSPMDVLIIPRVLALIIIMPCLAFISDLGGLLGGGLMVISSMDVSIQLYISRIAESVTIGGFWIGILKAPLFGAIIGIVSCFEGLRVQNTAESIGVCTTRSVVEGIFLVTLADALLSVFFSKIGI